MKLNSWLSSKSRQIVNDESEIVIRDDILDKKDEIQEEADRNEWIWVEGFKATDKDMCCQGFQYRMNEKFIYDEEPECCRKGYHLCLFLKDTYAYYNIGSGNRYFKVEALIKNDYWYQNYGHWKDDEWWGRTKIDKVVAKEIIFIEELSTEEIMSNFNFDHGDLPREYWEYMRENDYAMAMDRWNEDKLISYGYAAPLVKLIVRYDKTDIAEALEAQKELTIKDKIACIVSVLK